MSPTIVPLNTERHLHLAIKPQRDYRFAADKQFIKISGSEFPKAAQFSPITFIKQGDHFSAIALLGLEANQNLFVDPATGRWLADYVPADLRAYPFSLQTPNDQSNPLVCFIEQDSHLVDRRQTGAEDASPLFDEQGSPTQTLQDLLAFFKAQQASYQHTQAQISLLDELGLFTPWELKVGLMGQDKTVSINGLYRIDEARLNALPAEQFERLRPQGGLTLIYSHLLSLSLIRRLQQLHFVRGESPSEQVDVDGLFGAQDDTLKFNF